MVKLRDNSQKFTELSIRIWQFKNKIYYQMEIVPSGKID